MVGHGTRRGGCWSGCFRDRVAERPARQNTPRFSAATRRKKTMKRSEHQRRAWHAAAIAIILTLIATNTEAVGPDRSSWEAGTQIIDYTSYFDANSLLMFVSNAGSFAYDKSKLLGKTDGLYFPRGSSKTCVYSAGLWIGAKVFGDVRIAVAEYES